MEYWWKKAHIYELYIDKFAENIRGLESHLDYFTTLGIDCLHLLPHYPSPMIDDGYDVSDYRGVRSELGTLEDFKSLIRSAHSVNIKIIIDLVLNHTSDQHPWFQDARSSKKSSKRDYYLWSDTGTEFALAPNAFPDLKDHNWIRNNPTHDYYFATFYPEQADLNWDNPAVMEEFVAIMRYWAELGVDGFRIDAAPHLIKRDGTDCKHLPETHAVLKHLRKALEAEYPDVILLAEVLAPLPVTKEYFGGAADGKGDECHMCYHFGLMEEVWLALRRGDLTRLKKMAEESIDIPENCQWAVFLRNHDEIAIAMLSPEDQADMLTFLDPERRYTWEKFGRTSMRIASVFNGDTAKIRRALELLYSLPGAPVMYYGDEIGMVNLALQKDIVDTRKYVRGPFDWEIAKMQMQEPDSLFNGAANILKAIRSDAASNT